MERPSCHSDLPDEPAESGGFTYAAFISYRHLPRDAEIARRVQRAIETYRLPRGVASTASVCAADGPTSANRPERTGNNPGSRAKAARSLGKCFRDEDELAASPSLPASIHEALEKSRSMVVICSPETGKSTWVQREIETFSQLHGRDRIICVLADGDSSTSIPSLLKTRMVPDASGVMREMPAEPLAADLRPGATAKPKAELLRIVAAVAGVPFDDLRQRERARRRKLLGVTACITAALLVLITALAVNAFHASQNALMAESRSLAAQAQDQLARGERLQAIETALSALPSSESDHSRPLVPEAQTALEEALGVNSAQNNLWKPNFAFDADGEIKDFVARIDGEWVATLSENGTVDIIDTLTGAHCASINLRDYASDPMSFHIDEWLIEAVDKGGLLVANRKGNGSIACFEARTGSLRWEYPDSPVQAAAPSQDGTTVALFSAFEDGPVLVGIIDTAHGKSVDWMESESDGVLEPPEYAPRYYDATTSTTYLGVAKYALAFFLKSHTYEFVDFGNSILWTMKESGGMLVGGSSDRGGGENSDEDWWVDMPYAFKAVRVYPDGDIDDLSEELWGVEGTYEATAAGPALQSIGFLGHPRIHEFVNEGEPAVACSAGRSLRVLSLADGHDIYREDFANSVVAVGKGYLGDDSDFLVIALADGTLDVRLPLGPYTAHGTSGRTSIPYQVDRAILEQDDGNILALLHPSNLPDRLLSYTYDIAGFDDPATYSLDELIAQAHELLEGTD